MKRAPFASLAYDKKKKTRREKFLEEMEQAIHDAGQVHTQSNMINRATKPLQG